MTNLFPCTARLCANISGVAPTSDVTIYSLQDRLFFNGVPLSFLVTCPEGYYCPPGSFPRVITYPPGTFVIPFPPTGGFPIVLQLQGCQSLVQRTLPSDATDAQIQEAANEIIMEIGEQQAECDSQPPEAQENPDLITLSGLPDFFCQGGLWDTTITTDAPVSVRPLTFVVIGGDLPSGIVMAQSESQAFLSGTPSTMGTYNFTIGVGGIGAYGQQAYTVVVGGITTASPLPDAVPETPYSEALAQTGLTGTLTWGVAGGLTNLPDWLNLNTATGTLFGTPPENATGPYTFTITVTNGTETCEKEFTLAIEEPATCPDWEATVWGAATLSGNATFSGIGDTATISLQDQIGLASGIYDGVGSLTYEGPGCNCILRITVTDANPTGYSVWVKVVQAGFTVASTVQSFDSVGVFDTPFSVGDIGGPSTIEISGFEPVFGQEYWTRTGGAFNGSLMRCTVQLINVP